MSWWDDIPSSGLEPRCAAVGGEAKGLARNNAADAQSPVAVIAAKRQRACTRREVFALVGGVVVTAAVTWLLVQVVFGLAVVEGDSMEPSLNDGDLLLLWRPGTCARGDVVTFDGGDGKERVKRVVALPGETVEVTVDGALIVNGRFEEGLRASGQTLLKTGQSYPLTLGENEYFVLGDNRENSQDSRNYGPIQGSRIKGKVAAVMRVGC